VTSAILGFNTVIIHQIVIIFVDSISPFSVAIIKFLRLDAL
jgi:hypothetical protein